MNKTSPTGGLIVIGAPMPMPRVVFSSLCQEKFMVVQDFSNLEKMVANAIGSGKSEYMWNGLKYDHIWIDEISNFPDKSPKAKKIKPMRSTKTQVKPFWANDWRKK